MFEKLQSMDKRTLVGLAVATIVGILVFSAIAGGIRQAGWNEGFMIGQLAASSSGDGAKAIAPYLAARGGAGAHGWGGHGVGFFGGFFRFLFFGFLIMMAFRFFGFARWRMHSGNQWGGRGGWHGGPGQHGPWGHHQAQPTEPTQPEQASNLAGGAAQPSESKPQNTGWIDV